MGICWVSTAMGVSQLLEQLLMARVAVTYTMCFNHSLRMQVWVFHPQRGYTACYQVALFQSEAAGGAGFMNSVSDKRLTLTQSPDSRLFHILLNPSVLLRCSFLVSWLHGVWLLLSPFSCRTGDR